MSGLQVALDLETRPGLAPRAFVMSGKSWLKVGTGEHRRPPCGRWPGTSTQTAQQSAK